MLGVYFIFNYLGWGFLRVGFFVVLWVGFFGGFLCAVLVLARIGLIFFIVAGMGLCFGFLLETALLIQGCSSYCSAVLTNPQEFFSRALAGGALHTAGTAGPR